MSDIDDSSCDRHIVPNKVSNSFHGGAKRGWFGGAITVGALGLSMWRAGMSPGAAAEVSSTTRARQYKSSIAYQLRPAACSPARFRYQLRPSVLASTFSAPPGRSAAVQSYAWYGSLELNCTVGAGGQHCALRPVRLCAPQTPKAAPREVLRREVRCGL